MDKPATFTRDAIRAEKLKFLESNSHNPQMRELKKSLSVVNNHSGTIEGEKRYLLS